MSKETHSSTSWKSLGSIILLLTLLITSLWNQQITPKDAPLNLVKNTQTQTQTQAINQISKHSSKSEIQSPTQTNTSSKKTVEDPSDVIDFQPQDLEIPHDRQQWVKRTRTYQVPHEIRNQERFTFQPFEDVALQVDPAVVPSTVKVQGEYYKGDIKDVDGSIIGTMDVTYVASQNIPAYFGRFILNDGRAFELHHHIDGQASVSEVEYNKLPYIEPEVPKAPDLVAQHSLQAHPPHTHTQTQTSSPMVMGDEVVESAVNADPSVIHDENHANVAANNNATIVSILLVGSQRAVNSSGGQSAFDSRVAHAINIANEAYVLSEVNMQLVVVRQEIINNPRQTGLDVLSQLASPFDNFFDNIPTLRSQVLADMVIVIDEVSDRNRICGIGYLGPSKFYSYSVTDWQCTSNHTVTHEVGHNMGSHHDENNAPSGFQPAYGHRFGPYRTIMAYAPGIRTGYLSNPNVTAFGLPTGTTQHNNALVHNNNVSNVASFFGGTRIINGQVLTRAGDPLAGVNIQGPTGTQVTNQQGEFSFVGLSEGLAYTLTADKQDYSFTPKSIQNVLDQDQNENFTASITPQLQIAEAISFNRAASYTLQIPAIDADDQVLTFVVEGVSMSNLTVQPQNKSVTVDFSLPTNVSQATLVVEVTDGIGTDIKQINISVENLAPTLVLDDTYTMSHNAQNFSINLQANDPNNDPLTYTVEVEDYSATVKEILDINRLVYLGTDDNIYGLGEIVLHQGTRRFILLDDGRLMRWGGNLRRSSLIATISPLFHQYPHLLKFDENTISANAQAQINNGFLSFTKTLGFTGVLRFNVTVSDGTLSATAQTHVVITNIAPEISEIEDVFVHAGAAVHLVNLEYHDADQDSLAVEINVQSAADLAYTLNQELNLVHHQRHFNRLRLQEHRFTSGRQVYILLPDGRLLHWNSRLRANSPMIAHLTEEFYQNPTLLSEAQAVLQPEVSAHLDQNQIVLDPLDNFVGSVRVYVTVTDQVSTVQEEFNFTTQNEAPILAEIPDQGMHFSSNTHQINLQVSDADQDPIVLTAEAVSEDQIAVDLQNQYNFTYQSRFDNRVRLDEKRLQSGRQAYMLLPDGRILEWNSRLRGNSPVIAQINTKYYDDPNLLIQAEPPANPPFDLVIQNQQLHITRTGFFADAAVITVTADDGFEEHQQSFTLSSGNQAPVLSEITDINRHVSQQNVSIQLQASDSDFDPLSFDVDIQSTQNLAYQLDQQYNFVLHERHFNRLRLQEHRFTSGRTIFALLPNGNLLEWNSRLRANSPVIAQLPTIYYDHPNLLVDIDQPSAPNIETQVDQNTQMLQINYLDTNADTMIITVTVNDGKDQSIQSFSIYTYNQEPTIQEIPHVRVHAGAQTHHVNFVATDVDSDDLSFDVVAKSMQQIAYELDQEHNFIHQSRHFNRLRLQEHRFTSGRVIFALLPNGQLLQWNSRLRANSPVIAHLSTSFYDDPSLLVDVAQPAINPVSVSVLNQVISLTPQADFLGTIRVTLQAHDLLDTTSTSFLFTTENQEPTIQEIAHVNVHAGAQTHEVAFVATDADTDDLSFEVEVKSMQQIAYELDQEYNFVYQSRHFNRLSLQEHRLTSGSTVFVLLPNGDVLQWNSRLRANSPVIAQLPTTFYDDPTLLVDVAQPIASPVQATITNQVLSLTPQAEFLGTVKVKVQASDAFSSTSQSFLFTTENQAPVIHAPEQLTLVGQTINQVIPIIDPDGDSVSTQVSVASESSLITTIRDTYNLSFRNRFNRLRLQEYLFVSNQGTLVLLPDGKLLKWDARLRENSNVLAILPPSAYDNPQAIATLQNVPSPVQAYYQNETLYIERLNSNESAVIVTLRAQDAWDQSEQQIIVNIDQSSYVPCGENEYVNQHECTACPPGTHNEAGDDAQGENSTCDLILCAQHYHVVNHNCVPCPTDLVNEAGDDASGADTSCTVQGCGDGFLNQGEECDQGMYNHDYASDTCRSDCTLPRCGDAVVDSGEGCDDGNLSAHDFCSDTCQPQNWSAPLLVLMIDFANSDINLTLNDAEQAWSDLIFGDQPAQGNHYWSEVFQDRFSLEPAIESAGTANDGVIRIQLNDALPNSNQRFQIENQNWIPNALEAASSFIDFSMYDQNNDARLDQSELSVLVVLNMSFSNVSGAGAQANIQLNHLIGGTLNLPVFARTLFNYDSIGVNMHELGHHILGLDHFVPPGNHGLMSTGAYAEDPVITSLSNNNSHWGTRPTHPISFSRIRSGWISPELIDVDADGSTIDLYSIHSDQYNIALLPIEDGYLLLENREALGYDASIPFCDPHQNGLFITEVAQYISPLNITQIQARREDPVYIESFDFCERYGNQGYNDTFEYGGYRFSSLTGMGNQLSVNVEKLEDQRELATLKWRWFKNDPNQSGYRLWWYEEVTPTQETIIDFSEIPQGNDPNGYFTMRLTGYYNTGEERSLNSEATWSSSTPYVTLSNNPVTGGAGTTIGDMIVRLNFSTTESCPANREAIITATLDNISYQAKLTEIPCHP